jgi:glycosyltransferase involved in cell wall biosynthesis
MIDVPVVSVLMPCYNAAITLEEALNSLSRQSLSHFEVIAVDDGSTDATPEILRDWSQRDNRFRVVNQPHRGVIEALNVGLARCRSPYVARMDADDRCRHERLEKQIAYLGGHPETAVVACRVEAFPRRQVRQGFRVYIDWQNALISDRDIRREIFVESPMAHPSIVFRREWVQEIGGYQDNGWAEDYDLFLRLYLAGARFAKLPQVLLDWRERPQRLTRTDGRYSLENFLRAKAHYLARGPMADRDGVIIWGAGMMGRRLSKHLLRQELPLKTFVDIDPRKIGRTRRGLPIVPPQELPDWWARFENPAVLAAVGARGARELIRQRLKAFGWREGRDWWGVA